MVVAAPLLVLGACQKSTDGAPAPVVNKTVEVPPAEVAATRAATATNVGPKAAPIVTRAAFAKAAAVSDLYEIQAGRLAEQRSGNQAVRSFADKMVHDHTASSDNLTRLLGTDGVGIGVTPTTDLDAPHKAMIEKLAEAAPGDFDRTYADQQVTAHQQAADLFNGYAQGGDAPPLKTFAMHALPMINDHLAKAKQLQISLATGAGPIRAAPG